jgi:alginate O-acetyltransferase complex protein AlgI
VVFSSAFFLFAFLPVFLAAYYAAPFRLKTYVVLAASYVFYGWWRIDCLALLFLVTFVNYHIGRAVYRAERPVLRRRLLALAVTLDLGVLFAFKYWNFFAQSFAEAFNGGEALSPALGAVILPLGISFYVFEAISYVVDMYRRDAAPADRFVDFAAFITLFPHLVAGPVLRYKDLADQFRSRSHSLSLFGEGAARFFLGLAKKVLIADTVAPLADAMFAVPDPTLAESWLGALAYSIQLYFDFSGYSSMAIGLGLMMGFRFVENFRFPYLSRSITEFWRRWHLSLSAWLRDYLYIPLGGSRRGVRRTYLNLFLTMFLGGVWHGANWTFVAWGTLHGAALALERRAGVDRKRTPAWRWPLAMLIVVAGWVLFRAPTLAAALACFEGMLGLNGVAIRDIHAWQVTDLALSALVIGIGIALTEPWLHRLVEAAGGVAAGRSRVGDAARHSLGSAAASLLGVLAVVKLVADSDSPFLYFQF